MPLRSAAVLRVLRHGFPPPSNPGVERTTRTLRTDTDITKPRDLAHKTRVVASAVKTHTYICAVSHRPGSLTKLIFSDTKERI